MRTDAEIVIMGAGPHSLTFLLFLLEKKPEWRDRIVVIDQSGAWLKVWNARMKALQIAHLRSSSVHHPHPVPYALRKFAGKRTNEFYSWYELPGTQLFHDFTEELILEFRCSELLVKDTVTSILPPGSGGRFQVTTATGHTYRPRFVVAAPGSGSPNWPAWVHPEWITKKLVLHSHDIDLSTTPIPKKLLIVGGGLTSAQLALGACKAGARVELFLRSPLKVQYFDSPPGWIGPKYLTGFRREKSWSKRATLIRRARGGGSVTPQILEELQDFLKGGQLVLRQKTQLRNVAPTSDGWKARFSFFGTADADQIWCATGYQMNQLSAPLWEAMHSRYPLTTFHGLPLLEADLSWSGQNLYLLGALAALRLGPTARNLPGARTAAELVSSSIVAKDAQTTSSPGSDGTN